MSDLISRTAAIAKVEKARKAARTLTGMDFVMMLKDQPAVDAVPVVHGRWIDDVCSECGQYVYHGDANNYCPFCGARMDG